MGSSRPNKTLSKEDLTEVLVLRPAIERFAAALDQKRQQSLLNEEHIELLAFLKHLVRYLRQEDDFYEGSKAIAKVLPRFPRILTFPASPDQFTDPAFTKMVAEFVLAVFIASLPPSPDIGEENVDKAHQNELMRTEELLLETLTTSLDSSPDAPSQEIGTTMPAPKRAQTSPLHDRPAPAPRSKVSPDDDFMGEVAKAKGIRPQGRGFNNSNARWYVRYVLELPQIFLNSLDNIALRVQRLRRGRDLSNTLAIGAVGLFISFSLGAIGFLRMHGAVPVQALTASAEGDLKLAPEIVLPDASLVPLRAIEVLHGFGEHGREVEVSIDDRIVGSARIDELWTWSLSLKETLGAGTYRIKVGYRDQPAHLPEGASVPAFTSSERKVTIVPPATWEEDLSHESPHPH